KLIALRRVGGRDVDIQRPERLVAGIPDLVPVAAPDQDERPLPELDAPALDDGLALATDHEQPLVRALVPVVRSALGVAGGERHLGGLGVFIAEDDLEAVAELKVLVLHRGRSASRFPRRARRSSRQKGPETG